MSNKIYLPLPGIKKDAVSGNPMQAWCFQTTVPVDGGKPGVVGGNPACGDTQGLPIKDPCQEKEIAHTIAYNKACCPDATIDLKTGSMSATDRAKCLQCDPSFTPTTWTEENGKGAIKNGSDKDEIDAYQKVAQCESEKAGTMNPFLTCVAQNGIIAMAPATSQAADVKKANGSMAQCCEMAPGGGAVQDGAEAGKMIQGCSKSSSLSQSANALTDGDDSAAGGKLDASLNWCKNATAISQAIKICDKDTSMTPDGSRQNGMGGMTQSDACAQTKKRADDITSVVGKYLESATPAGVINAIGNAFGAHNKLSETLQNNLGITMNTTSVTRQTGMCNNSQSAFQTNTACVDLNCPNPYATCKQVMNPATGCMHTQCKAACGDVKDCQKNCQGFSDQQAQLYCLQNCTAQYQTCLDASDKFQKEQAKHTQNVNITQAAKSAQAAQCSVNMKALVMQKADASIANEAMQKIEQTAKNSAAGNNADIKQCNNINVNMSACQAAIQTQCCTNNQKTTQQNIIDIQGGCAPANIEMHQKLDNTQIAMCELGASTTMDQSLTAAIKNKTKQTASQTAIGPDLTIIFLAIIIILGILVIAPEFLAIWLGSKIFVIIGPILLCIGIGMYVWYLSSKSPAKNNVNSPLLYLPKNTVGMSGNPIPASFEDAYKQWQTSDAIVAFDFFATPVASGDGNNGCPQNGPCTQVQGEINQFQSACQPTDGNRTKCPPTADAKAGANAFDKKQSGIAVFYNYVPASAAGGQKAEGGMQNVTFVKATDSPAQKNLALVVCAIGGIMTIFGIILQMFKGGHKKRSLISVKETKVSAKPTKDTK